ncbi:MAG: hypothetical protein J6J12_00905 [Oscillospiraceae bacterium]|nr:hypothetical protein [Oscillospiraceae bacterium]
MAPYFFEDVIFTLLAGLMAGIPSMMLSCAGYVLTAVAIYVIARRRGLGKPWLAWIPVVNVWLLGSLSDQYQYVVRRKNTNRRKWLLVLNFIKPILAAGTLWFGMIILQQIGYGVVLSSIWDLWLGLFGFGVPLMAVSIVVMVIRYMALYDVYKSLDPENAVLFVVLSIFVSIIEPFFLFFNRNKDKGMPPRKGTTIPDPQPEAWENTQYL